MGITNNIPPSRLIQPGVIDNTAARPASPFEGQCIFQKDTDQLLVWNGTAWVIPNSPAQNPDGLELTGTTTFSSASIPFINGCFSSTYQNYRIIINIVGTASSNLRLRTRYGTSTTESTSVYDRWGFSVVGGAITNQTSPGETALFLGGYYFGEVTPYIMDVFSPNETTRTMIMPYSWNSATGAQVFMPGRITTNTSYTGIELICDSGTLTGSMRVYGYRK